jgi:hypothetical protein
MVHVIAAAVLLANGKPPGEVIARLVTLPFGPLLMVFAWVTVVCAVLDRSVPRLAFITKWNPSSLPEVREKSATPSMASRIGEVAMATMFVLWLAAIPHYQWLIFGPAATLIELGPVWSEIHLTLLVLASAGLAVSWVNLLYPQRRTFRLAAKVAGNVVSVLVFWFLLNADALILPTQSAGAVGAVAAAVNRGVRIAFMVVVIAALVETVRDGMRLIRRLRLPRYSSF